MVNAVVYLESDNKEIALPPALTGMLEINIITDMNGEPLLIVQIKNVVLIS